MSLQANFPTDRPKVFNLVNAEAIDPRLDFSRPSVAFYQAKDGFIKSAAENVPRINYGFNPLDKKVRPQGLILESEFVNYAANTFEDPYRNFQLQSDGTYGPFVRENRICQISEQLEFAVGDSTRPVVRAPDGVTDVHQCYQTQPGNPAVQAKFAADTAVTAAGRARGFLVTSGDSFSISLFVKIPETSGVSEFDITFNAAGYTDPALTNSANITRQPLRLRVNVGLDGKLTGTLIRQDVAFKNTSFKIDPGFPNGWHRCSYSAEMVSDLYMVISTCKISFNKGGAGTGIYFWGKCASKLPNCSPFGYKLTQEEYMDWGNTQPLFNTDTFAKAIKKQDSCALDKEFLSANTDLISPCLYFDVETDSATSGCTFVYGSNSDQSNSVAYYQQNLAFIESINGVDNSGNAYENYPKFTLPNGRIKFVIALNTPAETGLDQLTYFSGAQVSVVSEAPQLSSISLVTDSINSGINAPEGSVAIKAFYIYEGALSQAAANSLLGSSTIASGGQQPSNPVFMQLKLATDPDAVGELSAALSKDGRGLEADGSIRILWGDGSNEPYDIGVDYEHVYALSGIYNVQVHPDAGDLTGFMNSSVSWSQAHKFVEITDWGESLVFNFSGRLGFAGFSNIIRYPRNTDVDAKKNLDFSRVTDFRAFVKSNTRCVQFPVLNLVNATNISECFAGCEAAAEIFAGGDAVFELPTGQAYKAWSLFADCKRLDSDNYDGNVLTLNTSECTNARQMFYNCESLKAVSNLDLSNCDDFSEIFSGCQNLTEVPQLTIPSDPARLLYINSIFKNCKIATEASLMQIETWDTSNTLNMAEVFSNCYTITRAPALNTDSVERLEGFFSCSLSEELMTTGPLVEDGNWNTSNCQNFARLFTRRKNLQCTSATNKLDTSSATSMRDFHYGNAVIERPYFGPGGITSVTYLGTSTSYGCAAIFANALNLDLDVDANGRIAELWPCNTNMFFNAFVGCTSLSNSAFTAILKTLDDSAVTDGIVSFASKYQPTGPGPDQTLVNSLEFKGWTIVYKD